MFGDRTEFHPCHQPYGQILAPCLALVTGSPFNASWAEP